MHHSKGFFLTNLDFFKSFASFDRYFFCYYLSIMLLWQQCDVTALQSFQKKFLPIDNVFSTDLAIKSMFLLGLSGTGQPEPGNCKNPGTREPGNWSGSKTVPKQKLFQQKKSFFDHNF